MKILDKLNKVLFEDIGNGVYFFKDTRRKPMSYDRIKSKYDGSQFVSDTGRISDESYLASSMTILYDGKRLTIDCKDVSPNDDRIKVCIRYGINNYEWKYLL